MKEYMGKYSNRIFLMGLFVFLIHGAKLNSNVIGIDTEDLIQYQDEFYGGWLNTGRQGLVLLKYFMDNLSFNPYFSGLLTLLFFAVAVVATLMLWDKVWKKEKASVLAWVACGGLWISHPIITEQFYFTLQSAEISIGIFLTALALYLIYCGKKSVVFPIVSGVLLILTFSIYQSFIVIYIFGAVALILLQGLRDVLEEEQYSAGKLLFRMVPYVSVFLVAFLVNSFITSYFFQTSDYLSNQIQWGKSSTMMNLRQIAGHVLKTLTGSEGIYYNYGYGILCLVTVVTMIVLLLRFRKKKSVIAVMLFYLAALLTTPYLMTVVIGGAPACRSQLVLPMITGFLAYLSIEMLLILKQSRKMQSRAGETASREKVFRIGRCVLVCGILMGSVVGIWKQTQTTLRLYYTDSMRFEQDVAIARDIMTRIEEFADEEDVALVVVGSRPFEGNNACIEGEVMGQSFFDHDVDAEPPYYWSTKRVLGLFHILGADYDIAPLDRFDHAIELSWYMPEWPAYECIQEQDGVIVIKMGE